MINQVCLQNAHRDGGNLDTGMYTNPHPHMHIYMYNNLVWSWHWMISLTTVACESGSSVALPAGGNLFTSWDVKYFLFGAQFHIWVYVLLLLQVRCGCTGVDVGKDCKVLFLFSLSRKIKIKEIFIWNCLWRRPILFIFCNCSWVSVNIPCDSKA